MPRAVSLWIPIVFFVVCLESNGVLRNAMGKLPHCDAVLDAGGDPKPCKPSAGVALGRAGSR